MAKGLKMAAARKNCSRGQLEISRLRKSDNGSLLCVHCPAKIQYVSAHKRRDNHVSAYLKLQQNENHEDNCPNSVDGAINLLVAQSEAIEDGKRILQPDADGKHLFRMNILVDALRFAGVNSEMAPDPDNSERTNIGINYVRSEHNLASYFRSASGVVRIRALLESSDINLLTQRIEIEFNGRIVKWDDFYYDQERYPILYKRLKNKEIDHPVALKLTIKQEDKHSKTPLGTMGRKRFPWSFQCFGKCFSDNGNRRTVIPRVRLSTKEDFSNIISERNTVLAVGSVWADGERDKDFGNISVAVYHKLQICKELDIAFTCPLIPDEPG